MPDAFVITVVAIKASSTTFYFVPAIVTETNEFSKPKRKNYTNSSPTDWSSSNDFSLINLISVSVSAIHYEKYISFQCATETAQVVGMSNAFN